MKRYFRFLNELHKTREDGTYRTPEEVRKNFKEGHLDTKPTGRFRLIALISSMLIVAVVLGVALMNIALPEREPVPDETTYEYNVISVDLPRGGSACHRKDESRPSSGGGRVYSKSTKGGCSSNSRVLKKGIFARMSESGGSQTIHRDAYSKGSQSQGIDALVAGGSGIKRGGGGRHSSGGGIGFHSGSGSSFTGGCHGGVDLSNLSGIEEKEIAKSKKRKIKKVQRPSLARSPQSYNTEEYAPIKENSFKDPFSEPLSTVSIDVDNASYTNLRRILNSGSYPAKNSVRLEEAINYFKYDYPEPTGLVPFSVTTEVGQSPWNEEAKLLHIGLKGQEIFPSDVPRSNLVFLLDVSGSMSSSNKLPLLKRALPLLVKKLTREDRVSIVVYAGAAGVVLPSTSGDDKNTILSAIENLHAGGSTAGGAGIKLAYQIAEENFIKDGNNRIILATDGDFNVGVSSTAALVDLMKVKREKGIALTVLGFGDGNYKDSRMEQIADKGNGNYFYIDNMQEAKKVLSTEMVSTLHTIAKDVKLQIEFNPAHVQQYRLVGYVNRVLAAKDFDDDTKDAGELGAGHTVTALYEIIPRESNTTFDQPLKYQKRSLWGTSSELGTVKLRWKKPRGSKSTKKEYPIINGNKEFAKCSENYRFSASVAEFILKVNGSTQTKSSWAAIKERAASAKGKDTFGYRKEFLSLIDKAEKNISNTSNNSSQYSNHRPHKEFIGSRSRANIMRSVRNNMASLKYAYNRRRKDNPNIGGKIKVKWAIDEFGNVLHCKLISSNMGDQQFEKEVMKKIKSWAFGKINVPGDVTEVTYPFVFTQ